MDKQQQLYKGRISFINYEKQFATIDYTDNNKQKSVNCKTNAAGPDKKPRHYRLGDVVSFQLKLSDRGDKMTADNVIYLYNTSIDLLIQKAAIENRFSGYLKKVDASYFVKEWESYILFPLILSPWEKPPAETAANEAISFRLLNLEKPNSIAAELFSHNYIAEYKKALDHFNNKLIIQAVINKITPHAVFLDLFGGKVKARLTLQTIEKENIQEGNRLPVRITHLTHTRIVVERVKPGDE